MPRPLLIIVSGRPGSGKTTLAHAIAREVCCPALCRDEMKEGYCISHGACHSELPADTNRKLYDVFFSVIRQLLDHRVSLVAEAAFQHKLWAPQLEPLMPLCDMRLVLCCIDPLIARQRLLQRGESNPRRERFHRDFAVHAARKGQHPPIGAYDPPQLTIPTIDVDTTNGYRPTLPVIVDHVLRGRRDHNSTDAIGRNQT